MQQKATIYDLCLIHEALLKTPNGSPRVRAAIERLDDLLCAHVESLVEHREESFTEMATRLAGSRVEDLKGEAK